MRDCTIKLGTGVKAETVHVDKLRIVGYPTTDEPNGNKSGGVGPAGQKIKREME